MAFIISQSEHYTWPVVIEIPVDGGRYEKQSFDAEFRRTTQVRIDEIMEEALRGEMKDRLIAAEMLVGWKGISDGSGDIPFSESAVETVLSIPTVAMSIVKAWMESLQGARKKN